MASAEAKTVQQPTMAEQADIHELYEEAVQNVENEVEFLRKTFTELRGRNAVSFREDFCGTASAACEWVKTGQDCHAVGVDIDPAVLEWGRRNRIGQLPEADRARVKLMNEDVLTVDSGLVDIVGAFNFSYWIFRTREQMRAYFERVREALTDDGVLFLDIYGGSEAYETQKEKTKYDGFTYIWHQAKFEPVTGRALCYIHFKFPDGSRIKRAFSYEWRIWTAPELRELLLEAGFKTVRVYWEDEDEDGEGTGEFYEEDKGEPDPAWISYIVAEK